MEAITCGDICELLATDGERLHRATLERWIAAGVVRPASDSQGHRLYRALDVLALIVARGLRDNSVGLDVAAIVGGWIRSQSIDELQCAIGQGRTHLSIVDGKCCPRLYPPAAIHQALASREEALRTRGITCVTVDVGAAFQRLEAALIKEKQPA